MERGEFSDLSGRGEPIAGLDESYDPLWWVKRWAEREGVTAAEVAGTPPSIGTGGGRGHWQGARRARDSGRSDSDIVPRRRPRRRSRPSGLGARHLSALLRHCRQRGRTEWHGQ
ncbi:MAG: DUF1992 domain-containing protein [bacterium]|nr:DUF1992 domain-containing protein [bacterium]